MRYIYIDRYMYMSGKVIILWMLYDTGAKFL